MRNIFDQGWKQATMTGYKRGKEKIWEDGLENE